MVRCALTCTCGSEEVTLSLLRCPTFRGHKSVVELDRRVSGFAGCKCKMFYIERQENETCAAECSGNFYVESREIKNAQLHAKSRKIDSMQIHAQFHARSFSRGRVARHLVAACIAMSHKARWCLIKVTAQFRTRRPQLD